MAYLSREEITLNGETVLFITYQRFNLQLKPDELYCDHLLKICWILQGNGGWIISGKKYEFTTGDIFLLNNSDPRSFQSIDYNEDMIIMTLEFEPRFIWSSQKSLINPNALSIFFNNRNCLGPRITKEMPLAWNLYPQLQQLGNEAFNKLPHYQQLITIISLNCLVTLNRFLEMQKGDLEVPNMPWQHSEAFSRILDYIDNHLSENLTLQSLSSIAVLNPSYFSRTFKKYNGVSLSIYIMKLRVQKSINYLTSTQKSIDEIYYLCGFNSISNYYKAFRQITGKTPYEYRRNWSIRDSYHFCK